jgi:hypothetical protein
MNRSILSCLLVVGLATAGAAHAGRSNETLVLEGLVSGGTRTTGLALANLAGSAAQCTVTLTDAGGAALGKALTVSVEPRSHRYLDDVFAGFDGGGIEKARAAVSCTGAFHAFAVIPDRAEGTVAVIDPLSFPTKAGVAPCATGSKVVCFDAKGIVHQPSKATPVKRLSFALPPGIYGRVRMTLDVTVSSWYAPDQDAKHLVYWFVLNKNFDMLGMLYFRGPNASTALSRYGVGLTHPQKIKLVKPFKAVPGRTYRCENDLDMAAGVITINVTDTVTGAVTKLRGVANVRQLSTKVGDRLIIDMAFPEDKTPDEVPSYGWIYKDVHIEAYPK